VGGFDDYLTSLGLSPETRRVYVGHVARLADNTGSPNAAITISAVDVAAFTELHVPRSTSSRRQFRCAMKYWWEHAGRADPPLRAIRVPPKRIPRSRALEPDQARDLVKAALGWHPQGTAVLLGLYMALRREEIAVARWDRFDADMEWYTVTGKFDQTADIPVHPVLRDELAKRSTAYVWLFPGSRNRAHVTPTTVWLWTKQVAESAGVGSIQTHQLRHTAITTAHDNTGDLRAASVFARHKRLESTRVYTRTTSTQLKAAVDALDYL